MNEKGKIYYIDNDVLDTNLDTNDKRWSWKEVKKLWLRVQNP